MALSQAQAQFLFFLQGNSGITPLSFACVWEQTGGVFFVLFWGWEEALSLYCDIPLYLPVVIVLG